MEWIVLQFAGHLLSGFMVGQMATSSKRTDATHPGSQVCCSQSPCPCGGPLLTCASVGDTQTLKGRSGLVSCGVPGSWYIRGLVWALRASLAGMGFDSKCAFTPLTVLLGLLLCSWMWGIFFLVGSNILLLMVVQWLVAILEFLQEKMSTRPSIPPS